MSVYGLNARFPMTLYAEQWARLLEYAPTLTEFIKANKGKGKLSVKAAA